jgi:hypothetical protein
LQTSVLVAVLYLVHSLPPPPSVVISVAVALSDAMQQASAAVEAHLVQAASKQASDEQVAVSQLVEICARQ